MAKKGGGTSYTSKGQHSTANRGTLAGVRAERSPVDIATNLINAYDAGRNPWITIDNPDPKQTNKRRIRVRANDLWGMPKERVAYSVYGSGDQKKKGAK